MTDESDAWSRVSSRQDAKGQEHARVEGPFNSATDERDRLEDALEEFYDGYVYLGMDQAKVRTAREQVLDGFVALRLAEEEWSDITRRCNYIEDEIMYLQSQARIIFDRVGRLQAKRNELLEKIRRIK